MRERDLYTGRGNQICFNGVNNNDAIYGQTRTGAAPDPAPDGSSVCQWLMLRAGTAAVAVGTQQRRRPGVRSWARRGTDGGTDRALLGRWPLEKRARPCDPSAVR